MRHLLIFFYHKMAVNWLEIYSFPPIIIIAQKKKKKKKCSKLAKIALLPKYCRFTFQNDFLMLLHENAINEPLLCSSVSHKWLKYWPTKATQCLNCTIQWFGANYGKLINHFVFDSETKSCFRQFSQSTVKHESANLNELLCTFTYFPTINNT